MDRGIIISPCDGLLSIYGATEYLTIPMKGSTYTLTDLVPDREVAEIFQNGLCLVFLPDHAGVRRPDPPGLHAQVLPVSCRL